MPELKVGYMKWPNGAEAVMVSAESGEDSVRGLQSELLVLEEAGFFLNNESIIAQAELTCRLAPSRTICATTPRATPIILEWVERAQSGDPTLRMVNGSTLENADNLSDKFVRGVVNKYKGTRMEQVELEGKLILTNEDALFDIQEIEKNTVSKEEVPQIVEYAIGIDPSILSKNSKSQVGKKQGRKSDSVGIVVSGLGSDGLIYTLEDHTNRFPSAGRWMMLVGSLYDQYTSRGHKCHIVCEVNALGEEFIKMGFDQVGRSDVGNKIFPTFSTESKLTRLQPYALLHDQGKIKWKVEGKNLEALFQELIS